MPTAARRVVPFRKPPKKLRFTKRVLLALTPPAEGRYYVYDETTPSLALCVTATGKRTLYNVRKLAGRTIRLRLGAFPQVTIETARKLTAKHAAAVADGRDPQAERQQARAERTLRDLFDVFLEEHAKPRKRTWREDERQFNQHLANWGSRRLSTISHEDVRKLHATIGRDNGTYSANRLLALLRKLLNFGQVTPNPCVGVEPFREEERDRFLSPAEVKRFFAAVEAEADEAVRDWLMLLLLTGARKSNVSAMRWDDVDLDTATWRIPRTKNADPLRVHLPAAAREILTRRLADREDENPWVFPSHGATGHLVAPRMTWDRVREAAGLADVRLHDLRRTLGSWQATAGVSLLAIGKSLGHRSPQATRRYARLALDGVRAGVDIAVDAMLAAAAAPAKGGARD